MQDWNVELNTDRLDAKVTPANGDSGLVSKSSQRVLRIAVDARLTAQHMSRHATVARVGPEAVL